MDINQACYQQKIENNESKKESLILVKQLNYTQMVKPIRVQLIHHLKALSSSSFCSALVAMIATFFWFCYALIFFFDTLRKLVSLLV